MTDQDKPKDDEAGNGGATTDGAFEGSGITGTPQAEEDDATDDKGK